MREGVAQGEIGHVRRDGSRFTTAMTTTALRDAGNHLSGFIRVARDTTASTQTQRELQTESDAVSQNSEAAPMPLAYVTAEGTSAFATRVSPRCSVTRNRTRKPWAVSRAGLHSPSASTGAG